MNSDLTLADVERLIGSRLGTLDVACPMCGPSRKELRNRTREVLRIWRHERCFATFICMRCGRRGFVGDGLLRAGNSAAPNSELVDQRERQAAKATALWRRRLPAAGSPVEMYLREVRHYGGPIPATIGFLPPLKAEQHPAMIGAFGLVTEPEPASMAIGDVVAGIHLTLLRADGSGKAGTDRDKLMVGSSSGWPIVLAPPNDMLGLIVCEGIETGLSLAEATGCGVWAAGAACRMRSLADQVPDYMDAVTIAGEADTAGRKGALELAELLARRRIHFEMRFFGSERIQAT